MPFTEEDAINVSRKDKQYCSWCLLKEFPNKKCTRGGLDQQIDDVGLNRCTGSGRLRTVRTVDNVDAVPDLVQSQEDQPQTGRSVRQIARELSIPQPCLRNVIKQDLK